MTTLFLLLVCGVLFAVCVALIAVLAESKGVAKGILHQWRESIASRIELSAKHKALAKAEEDLIRSRQAVAPIVDRIIKDDHEHILQTVGTSNHHQLVHQLGELLKFLESHGHAVTPDRRRALFAEIELAYERARRFEEERARQAEIKAQMREEERVQREAERAVREAEREAAQKKRALEEAIRLLGNVHSEQIEQLRRELAEAQARAERTKSMAEQTKVGHVYVISNIGSFGKGVFKVGLTRRLDPVERIDELGDASVPFCFDVHALIQSPDAPALECKLHQELQAYRVNKVNLRKEFFRVDLETIIRAVKKHHGTVEYEADEKALEYLETLQIEREARGEIESLDEIEGVATATSHGHRIVAG